MWCLWSNQLYHILWKACKRRTVFSCGPVSLTGTGPSTGTCEMFCVPQSPTLWGQVPECWGDERCHCRIISTCLSNPKWSDSNWFLRRLCSQRSWRGHLFPFYCKLFSDHFVSHCGIGACTSEFLLSPLSLHPFTPPSVFWPLSLFMCLQYLMCAVGTYRERILIPFPHLLHLLVPSHWEKVIF